jgi:hypothetical protein
MTSTGHTLRLAATALLLLPLWPAGAVAASEGAPLSADAGTLLAWISASNDHAGSAFVIVDKKRAQLLVFDGRAQLRADSPVLLGAALGDDTVPGIGERPIAQVLPSERTTPAGRFVAERGRNAQGEDVVWVDYDAAVSMHRVRTGNALERRSERLATPTIADNRISYGCINVPADFYDAHVQPMFSAKKSMVYVLPDLKAVQQVFGGVGPGAVQDTDSAVVGLPSRVVTP